MQQIFLNKVQYALAAFVIGASIGFGIAHIKVVDEIAALKAEVVSEKDALVVEPEVLENNIFSEWRATVTGNVLSINEKTITIESENNKGSQVIIYLDADTNYSDARNGASSQVQARLQDIKTGDRIAVSVNIVDGNAVANGITIVSKLSIPFSNP